MVDTDGNEPSNSRAKAAPAKPVRRARTAAQQRAEREQPSAEMLVDDIEHTRENLAHTLDAIAEKVSPKRVAKRTTKKVGDTVKEKAVVAKEAVTEAAGTAKEAVTEAAGTAMEAMTEAAETVKEKAVEAKVVVADKVSTVSAAKTTPRVGTAGAAAGQAPWSPPVEVPPLARTLSAPRPNELEPLLKKEYAAAGAAVLVLLLLLRRRRRHKR